MGLCLRSYSTSDPSLTDMTKAFRIIPGLDDDPYPELTLRAARVRENRRSAPAECTSRRSICSLRLRVRGSSFVFFEFPANLLLGAAATRGHLVRTGSIMRVASAVAVALLAVAVLFAARRASDQGVAADLSRLAKAVGTPPRGAPKRFAVGLNACVDVIVPALDVFESLGLDGKAAEPQDHSAIDTLSSLEQTFKFFFSRGGAGERFVSDPAVFKRIADAARTAEASRNYIGGNAALIGVTIQNRAKQRNDESVRVLLGGRVGPDLRTLLGSDVAIAGGPSTDPADDYDEYHVILEYPKGAKWGGLVAPRANRFIVSHDMSNSRLEALEEFAASLSDFNPDTVVLSGLHMLEGEADAVRDTRLTDVKSFLRTVDVPIHLELASMANEPFVARIADTVFPYIDSLGLNEQELELLARAAGGPHPSLTTSDTPLTAGVAETLFWALNAFGKGGNARSRLTRIHFHSLRFHIIAQTRGSWSESSRAVIAGSWACTTRACNTSMPTTDQVESQFGASFPVSSSGDIVEIPKGQPWTQWTKDGIEFFLAPVWICKKPVSTVGLGDAISASGLAYSAAPKGVTA